MQSKDTPIPPLSSLSPLSFILKVTKTGSRYYLLTTTNSVRSNYYLISLGQHRSSYCIYISCVPKYHRSLVYCRIQKVFKASSEKHTPKTIEMTEKVQGSVKWFSNKKGYGFITPVEGSPISNDIFVHQSAIHSDGYRTLVSMVEFLVVFASYF